MVNKFVCIHGHFYQPPRENPWLEELEKEPSASPYHDWNERISQECYAPNAASRLCDRDNKILNIINNYESISFNFGPTLLSWMKKHQKEIYDIVVNSDKNSNAIAQCYNHVIMPLANMKDKETQVIWGIKDFEARFKRKPKGMWLPETAVDLQTLDIMQKNGIEFIILAPNQAEKIRALKGGNWVEKYSSIDTRMPYSLTLPSKNKITVFFYDGTISHDMAFKNLLKNGENFFLRITSSLKNDSIDKKIANVATDGETFGHHLKFSDMALAYCIYKIKKDPSFQMISYENFLKEKTPTFEVTIIENSSWSCAHKVGRWSEDCGCKLDASSNWNQKWRKPLREALELITNSYKELYEKEMLRFSNDPWEIRNAYIEVILDRSKENVENFIKKNAKKSLDEKEKIQFLKLLELQRFLMSMYTSCGWFFDDITRIETKQILTYAKRALQLGKELFNVDIEPKFLDILFLAKSNLNTNGKDLFENEITPKCLEIKNIAIYFSILSLFKDFENKNSFYCYEIEMKNNKTHFQKGKKLSLANISVESKITFEKIDLSFAAIHFEDQNILLGVSEQNKSEFFKVIEDEFKKDNIKKIKDIIISNFENHNFSFWDLLKEDQTKILNEILHTSIKEIIKNIETIYEEHYSLLSQVIERKYDLPIILHKSIDLVLNKKLYHLLTEEKINFPKVKHIVNELKKWGFEIDTETVSFELTKIIKNMVMEISKDAKNLPLIKKLNELFETFKIFDLNLDIWKSQNIFFSIFKKDYEKIYKKGVEKDTFSLDWLMEFKKLQSNLGLSLF